MHGIAFGYEGPEEPPAVGWRLGPDAQTLHRPVLRVWDFVVWRSPLFPSRYLLSALVCSGASFVPLSAQAPDAVGEPKVANGDRRATESSPIASSVRWIVLFRDRGFDLGTYRAAMSERAEPSVIAAIVGDLEAAAAADQADFVGRAQALGAELAAQWWLINGCALRATPDVVETLRRDPRVAFIVPDRLHRAMAGRLRPSMFQTDATDEWNHNAVEVHRRGRTGAGPNPAFGIAPPTIAVLDSQLEWSDPTAPAPWNVRSHSPMFDDANGASRIVDSVRVAGIALPATLTALRNHFAASIYNSVANFPGQHGSGIGHSAAARQPLPTAPQPAPGVGQAPGSRILSVDIVEDWTQLQSLFGCAGTSDNRYTSTFAITNACQFLATYAANYNTLAAVCAYGGSGNPWAPEQLAMDSLVANADVLMSVPSGNYFEDGGSSLGSWPSTGQTDEVNFRQGRDATAWDSMYGANSIVAGAAQAGSKIVPTWSGAGPLDPMRSSQSSSPFASAYGTTFCSGFVPDYFAVPNQVHDFSRPYPDMVAVGSAVTITERAFVGGQVVEQQWTIDGSSISCAQVAGAALLYRAGLDGAAAGGVPSALQTKAVLLAAAEDVAAVQPNYGSGPTGENLLGAGFLRTDHTVLGDTQVQSGALVPGQTAALSFVLEGGSTYGVVVAWNRTGFGVLPPAIWPNGSTPQPNGQPWADFDLLVTDASGVQSFAASPFGNRTWEQLRLTPGADGIATVQVVRNANGAATAEDFVVAVVKVASDVATPAVFTVPLAAGNNPCRSHVPASLPAPSVSVPVGSAAPGRRTYGVRNQNNTNLSWVSPSPVRAAGALQGTSLSVPLSHRGPDRVIMIGINDDSSGANGDYIAVDLACEADRDMLLPVRLTGAQGTLEGLLDVRRGQAVARALFGRGAMSSGVAANGSFWGSQRIVALNVNQWATWALPTAFQFEFDAPEGLRFLVRHGNPQSLTWSTTAPFPTTAFRYQWFPILQGTRVGGVVSNWSSIGSNPRRVVAAQMRFDSAQLVNAPPELVFGDDALRLGRPWRTVSRGFEVGATNVALHVTALAAATAPLFFSGQTAGLPCDCAVGLDQGTVLLSQLSTTDAGGIVRASGTAIPYDPSFLGLTLFHQAVVFEASGLLRTSQAIGTRIVAR